MSSYQPTVEKDFYLVRDLCAVTGLGKASVHKGIQRGELPGYKVDGRYVIPGPAFRAFCEGTWEPRPVWIDQRRPAPSDFIVNLPRLTEAS